MYKETNNNSTFCQNQHERIAKLAYHKAELRGFMPGHEMEDWILAEREILLHDCSLAYTNNKVEHIE